MRCLHYYDSNVTCHILLSPLAQLFFDAANFFSCPSPQLNIFTERLCYLSLDNSLLQLPFSEPFRTECFLSAFFPASYIRSHFSLVCTLSSFLRYSLSFASSNFLRKDIWEINFLALCIPENIIILS